MLPSVLLVASFSLPVEWTFTVRTIYSSAPVPTRSGGMAVPPQYAIEVWGDPPHLRDYPWNGHPLLLLTKSLPNSAFTPKEVKPEKPVPVISPDPIEERIRAIETVILELKAGGGSAAVIEQLQRDADDLKKSRKK